MNIPIGCLVKIHLLKFIYAHELNQAEINICAYMTITSRGYAGYILFCSPIDHWWRTNPFFFNSRRLLIDPLVLFMLHMQLLKFLFLKLSELCWTQ